MSTSRRVSTDCAGITLIEVLVVMGIIAVLSGIAISLLSGGHSGGVAREAANRIVGDLEYVRAEAIASHAQRYVVFDGAAEQYAAHSAGGLLRHPVTRKEFLVDLSTLYAGVGVDLDSINFGGGDTLRFDADGMPTLAGEVVVNAAGNRLVVSVETTTGRINIGQ